MPCFPLSPRRLLTHPLSLSRLSTPLSLPLCQSAHPIVLLPGLLSLSTFIPLVPQTPPPPTLSQVFLLSPSPSVLAGALILARVWSLGASAPGSEAALALAGDGSQPLDGQLGGSPLWPVWGVRARPMEEVRSCGDGKGWGALPGGLLPFPLSPIVPWLLLWPLPAVLLLRLHLFLSQGLGGAMMLLTTGAAAAGPTPIAASRARALVVGGPTMVPSFGVSSITPPRNRPQQESSGPSAMTAIFSSLSMCPYPLMCPPKIHGQCTQGL